MVLHLIPRYLSLKIGGEVRKRNRKGVNRTTEVSQSLDTKMWSVHYCHKTGHILINYFLWKKENKDKKGKQKEKHHDNDDRVTIAICDDDLIILRDHDSVNLVLDEREHEDN